MSVTHGMNSGEVEALGRLLQQGSDRLHGLVGDVDRLVHAATWTGDDGVGFLHVWPTHKARLAAVTEGLRGLGQSALNNAAEQLATSAAAGGGAAAVVGALAGGSLPAGWATLSAADRIRALSRMEWDEAATMWASLSPAEQRAIAMAGDGFGELDFVPPDIRFAINRELVRDEYLRLNGMTQLSPSEQHRSDLYARLLREHQQVLFFDPSGDGRIGVVHGDLNTASNIAVQVPGITNTLDNYWTLLDESQRLHGAAGGGDVAVVSWLGYETPSMSGEALTRGFAHAGATSLHGLVTAIDGARPDARITVVGHSYGSLATGLAASHGMPADQVVLIGSPGAGVDSVQSFARPDGSRPVVFVGQNSSDYVSNGSEAFNPVPGGSYYGSNPLSSGFGADHHQEFSTGGLNHSYYGAGSEQLEWLGGVIGGTTT